MTMPPILFQGLDLAKKGVSIAILFTNDYQQFLAHFELFLALFHISDVKPELTKLKQKVCKNVIFFG